MPVAWMTVALPKATKTQFKMALHFSFSHKYLESSSLDRSAGPLGLELIKAFYVNIHWLIRVWHLFRQINFTIIPVVIKDYESVFDAFTLM